MKINSAIVTGATGMIAIALIKKLIQDKVFVHAIIRPMSKNRYKLPQSNLLNIIECDISNISLITKQINASIDVFFHFAWEASSQNRDSDIDSQIMNIKYSLDAYKVASDLDCHKFIGAGSQAEYGLNYNNIIFDENIVPNPTTPYGIAKMSTARLLLFIADNSKTGVIWTRIFSVYGTNDHEHTLINRLLSLNNGEYFDTSSCEQYWDFLNEDDAGEAFYLLAKNGKTNQTYNISSGVSKPLRFYVEKVISILKKDIVINFGAIKNGKNNNLNSTIEKLQNDTGFIQKISFEDGIKKIIEDRIKKNE